MIPHFKMSQMAKIHKTYISEYDNEKEGILFKNDKKIKCGF